MVPLDVCKAKTVAEEPEPKVMAEPGKRVEPEMTYWDCGFAVIVSEPMVRAGRLVVVPVGRREVLEP